MKEGAVFRLSQASKSSLLADAEPAFRAPAPLWKSTERNLGSSEWAVLWCFDLFCESCTQKMFWKRWDLSATLVHTAKSALLCTASSLEKTTSTMASPVRTALSEEPGSFWLLEFCFFCFLFCFLLPSPALASAVITCTAAVIRWIIPADGFFSVHSGLNKK